MSHSVEALQYCEDIENSVIPSCNMVRLACTRHISDLHKQDNSDFEYVFDQEKGDRVCHFIELLHHTKGQWAQKKETIKLEPWQKFILTSLFGWVHKDTGYRRFREAYIRVARKNAKTTLAAGIGLYMLCADNEPGAEVFCGATTEKQAKILYSVAYAMVKKNPDLKAAYDLKEFLNQIVVQTDLSRFEPVVGQPGDGDSPHLAIIDEYHEHRTPNQYDTMLTGMGARNQPLCLIITTSGNNIASPCYEKDKDAQRVLSNLQQDDTFFSLIYELEKEDDWTDTDNYIKANPNLGVSLTKEYLESQLQKAINNTRQQNTFLTKHCNRWVSSRESWLNMLEWEACTDQFDIEKLTGTTYIIIDLSSRIDMTSLGVLKKCEIDGVTHYFYDCHLYLPDKKIEDDKTGKYQHWINDHSIIGMDGAEIDYSIISDDLRTLINKLGCDELLYDAWNARAIANELEKETGVTAIEIQQTVKNMSPAMKELEAAIKSKRFHHNNNPCLNWMATNVSVKIDANDNIFPRKETLESKIDGMVTLIMGIVRAMQDEPFRSAYEDEELIIA